MKVNWEKTWCLLSQIPIWEGMSFSQRSGYQFRPFSSREQQMQARRNVLKQNNTPFVYPKGEEQLRHFKISTRIRETQILSPGKGQ